MKRIKLLFTDLDDTLLDKNYTFKPEAITCIREAYRKNFAIVFTSSKTYAEQAYISVNMDTPVSYIVENGSAIYLPYEDFDNHSHKNGCRKFELSEIKGREIVDILTSLLADFPSLKFYSNSTIREISDLTGLSLTMARFAKEREYTETIFKGYNSKLDSLLREKGLVPQKGSKFVTIGDNVDKGKAAKTLIEILSTRGYIIEKTIAVGDGKNDIPLLKTVDIPYIIGDKISMDKAIKIQNLTEVNL